MANRRRKWAELGILILFFGGTPLLYKLGAMVPPKVKGRPNL